VVSNFFSKKYEEEGSLFGLSFIVADWLNVVFHERFQDSKTSILIQQFQNDSKAYPRYT
jgi:hypothetical protein